MLNGSNETGGNAGSTGLVALGTGDARPIAVAPKPLAGFVTQLLASCNQLPAYRARRRAEPAVALASYGGGGAMPLRSRYERLL